MYCKICGNKLDDDAVFCTKCGTHKDSMISYFYCEKCGSKFNKGAAFCTECGTPIPEKILENRKKLLQEQEVEFVRKKIKLGIIFIIIPLILLFIFGLLILFNCDY